MAQRVFTEKSIAGVSLEELRQALFQAIDPCNAERMERGSKLPTLYVSHMLREPVPGKGISFFVQYGDDDYEAPEIINAAIRNVIRNYQVHRFCLRRGHYFA